MAGAGRQGQRNRGQPDTVECMLERLHVEVRQKGVDEEVAERWTELSS